MPLDHDATYWFPMRVTYGRQKKVKEFLEREQVECFLPMMKETVMEGNKIRHRKVPAISNLLFVHDTMNRITALKQTKAIAAPLRYMTRRPVGNPDAPQEIVVVPDDQMQNFMRVIAGPDEEYTYLTPEQLLGKENGKVLITSGPFEGVEGIIKRVHGNKHVVVELEGLGGIVINFVPKNFMVRLE